ncbi:hypothetical protein VTJ04DRAFT_773 [Mycothermus thermophilus]|uniref:uncharacterized protein n=1 Tax=Humicola insolens TaxID=85995 RepID=UPI003743E61B
MTRYCPKIQSHMQRRRKDRTDQEGAKPFNVISIIHRPHFSSPHFCAQRGRNRNPEVAMSSSPSDGLYSLLPFQKVIRLAKEITTT